MKIAIVEDEKEAAILLKNHITKYATEEKYFIDVAIFNNPIIFLDKYNANEIFDVVFIDINMPQINGMELAKKIRKIDTTIIIVFVTNMSQFAIQGYAVNAFDFLVKPVGYESFKHHFDRIVGHYNLHRNDLINIKVGREYRQFSISDIYYVEMINHTAIWYTNKGVYQGTDKSLNEIEKMLPLEYFGRCSKAYLINFQHITSLKQDMIQVHDFHMRITRTYKAQFMKSFSLFLLKFGGE